MAIAFTTASTELSVSKKLECVRSAATSKPRQLLVILITIVTSSRAVSSIVAKAVKGFKSRTLQDSNKHAHAPACLSEKCMTTEARYLECSASDGTDGGGIIVACKIHQELLGGLRVQHIDGL